MDIKIVEIKKPEDVNLILGQTHFIKSVEDIYECMVTSVPGIKFGLAFSESSGPKLVRRAGTDEELTKIAGETMLKIGAGHSFIIFLRNAYPINVLPRLKQVEEVVTIFCATANPCQVIIAETEKGRGILGVIDGFSPVGIENENDKAERVKFSRDIGYKVR
jgi:hypothetical protein